MNSQMSGYRQVVLCGSAGTQRARILDLLQAWYPRPLSRHQISEYTGIPLNAVCGRIAALMDKGDGYNRKRKPQVRVAETKVYEPTGSLRDYLTIIIKEAEPSS